MTDSPARVTPKEISDALKLALTAFLTPDTANPKAASTDAEIKTLQSALGMSANFQTGNARVRTYQALQSSLGTPAEIQANPEIHSGITARITALTGIRPGQTPPPTPEQISAALSGLSRDQIAEVQILTGLIGLNNQALTNGQPNVDGIAGPLTRAALTSFASYNPTPVAPTVGATAQVTGAVAASTPPAAPVTATPEAPATPVAAAPAIVNVDAPKDNIILFISDRDAIDQTYIRNGIGKKLEEQYNVIYVVNQNEFNQEAAGLRTAGQTFQTFQLNESNHPNSPIEAEALRARTDLGETARYSIELDANNNRAGDADKSRAQAVTNVASQYIRNLAEGETVIPRGEAVEIGTRELARFNTALTAPTPAP